MKKPKVAITMGDPAGIGVEVILKALKSTRVRRACDTVVVGNAAVFDMIAKEVSCRVPAGLKCLDPCGTRLAVKSIKAGRLPLKWASQVPLYIKEAVRLALAGEVDAVVTAPINKGVLRRAGFSFAGHTEFLAHLTGVKEFAMMLGGDRLRVILVTIHVPLKDVTELVTRQEVLKVIRITDRAFKRFFGFKRPKIGVAGLNPHAGEGGLFGVEEVKVISPAIRCAQKEGIDAIGPEPPDTVFYRALKGEFDCVISMYHDQGLAPLKLIHFEDGFNTTLGLPIIRTSVDHGTAYDIAWQGKASAESMIQAILTASRMSLNAQN